MENKRKSVKNKRKRLWKSVLALLLGAAVLFSAQTEYLPGILEVYAAEGQADENGFLIENGILVKYTGTEKEVVIPAGVTGIGEEAFAGCSSLMNITIPEEVTSIGAYAFKGCCSLTSITIPKNITSIGDSAFVDCSGLASITVESGNKYYDSRENCNAIIEKSNNILITGCKNTVFPKGYLQIGAYAFRGCSGLTDINIPAGVASIEEGAFSDCSGITSITVDKENGTYDSRENCNAIIYTIRNELVSGCKNTVFPEIKTIGAYAFAGCSDLTDINFPDSVQKIGQYAFRDCSNITSVNIPGVSSIEEGAFSGCSGITSINIPNVSGTMSCSIKKGAFSGCSSLIYVNIEESVYLPVTGISSEAFKDCSSLTSIKIPASAATISDGTFSGCGKLTIYGEKGSKAETYALNNGIPFTGKEKAFSVESISNVVTLTKYTGTEKTAVIPKGVTRIGDSAFMNCRTITAVKIPQGVNGINQYAFSGCSNLTRVNFQEGVNPKDFGTYTFSNCKSLTSINLSGCTNLGLYAFKGCSSLTDIYAPNNLNISSSSFPDADCSKMTIYGEKGSKAETYAAGKQISFHAVKEPVDENGFLIEDGVLLKYFGTDEEVMIPEGVTVIGDTAFKDYSNMTSVHIPEGVTSIGADAFNSCTGLTSMYIPESVMNIGADAFAGCDGLTIYCEKGSYTETYAKENILSFYAIGNTADENGFLIEDGILVKYSGTDEEAMIPEEVTRIGDYAFSGCNSLTVIKIPASVKDIGNSVFSGCSSLRSMHIPASVKSIGVSTFAGCDKLIVYGEKASYTETYAVMNNIPFYAAESPVDENGFLIEDGVLTKYIGTEKEIMIPEGVTGIGASAFRGCSNITGIHIPESAVRIGADAFKGCSSLTDINLPDSITVIGNGAFKGCSSLAGMHIPAGVTSIGADTFKGCSSLASINIPAGVTGSIGATAFTGCDTLTIYGKKGSYAEIYSEVNNIPFYGAEEPVDENGFLIENGVLVKYFGTDKELVVPDGVTGIGEEAFSGCSNLMRVDIPKEVTRIGADAFAGCDKLTIYGEKGSYAETYAKANNIPFYEAGETEEPPEEEEFVIKDGVLVKYTGTKKEVVIPKGVTSIGAEAFKGCSGITRIDIPKAVTRIGADAFAGCDKLTIYGEKGSYAETYAKANNIPFYEAGETEGPPEEEEFVIKDGVLVKYTGTKKEVVIPKGVTSIGAEAFKGCSGIRRIKIPDGVTDIGNEAFSGCESLMGIDIPAGVIRIGTDAFAGCDKLTIYGEEGSYAETYAKANNIPFSLPEKNPDVISLEEMEQLIDANKVQDTIIQTIIGIIYTFKKGTMELPDVRDSYDFGTEITEDYAAVPNTFFTEDEFAFRIDYYYEGRLPGEAEITIPAGDKWAGKRLYYYEILEDGTYKYIGRSTVTEDGNYTITQDHGSSYVAATKVPENLGDCDGEKGITAKDALAVLKYDVGIMQENFAEELADCDGEDGITSKDALAILKYDVGLTDKFE